MPGTGMTALVTPSSPALTHVAVPVERTRQDRCVRGEAMSLTEISVWARSNGLELVLLVTGAILLTRVATWLGAMITGRIDAHARETDELVRSEASKHRHALAQVITWATLAIIYCATAVAIAGRVGIPVTSLVRQPPIGS
jgi:hypothetical protein